MNLGDLTWCRARRIAHGRLAGLFAVAGRCMVIFLAVGSIARVQKHQLLAHDLFLNKANVSLGGLRGVLQKAFHLFLRLAMREEMCSLAMRVGQLETGEPGIFTKDSVKVRPRICAAAAR